MMQTLQLFFFIWALLPVLRSRALDGRLNGPNKVAKTILVHRSGGGQFTSIQSAINSVPDNNNRWIRLKISAGVYTERVEIPASKPYIFMEGAGRKVTTIQWGDRGEPDASATFTSFAENFIAKGIAFRNNATKDPILPALAARIIGDKSAFFQCAFHGIQDTIWDLQGRHYFKGCYIEGAVDFIFGDAQSIYEDCVLSVNMGQYYPPGYVGYITAQKKQSETETNGFVFKNCSIKGNGKVYLGRAWGPCSTVIFYKSFLSDVVLPVGWSAWNCEEDTANITYAEAENRGPGADTSKRVPWEKKFTVPELAKFVNLSFINADVWLDSMPYTAASF